MFLKGYDIMVKELSEYRKWAWNCFRDSMCKSVFPWHIRSSKYYQICPSGEKFKFDAYYAQGRLDIARAIIEEEPIISERLKQIVFACQLCGACDYVCGRVKEMKPNAIVCSCSESIRLSGPIFPVVSGKVITVGESAGLVVAFGAAGIHTAFESAIILADHIYEGDITGYDKAMRRRFGWLRGIRKIWDSVEKGQVALLSLGASYRALRYQGLKPTLMDLLYIRKALIEANQ